MTIADCLTTRSVPQSQTHFQRLGASGSSSIRVHLPYLTPGAGTFSVLMFHITFFFLLFWMLPTEWGGDYELLGNSFWIASVIFCSSTVVPNSCWVPKVKPIEIELSSGIFIVEYCAIIIG